MPITIKMLTVVGCCAVTFAILACAARVWRALTSALARRRERERRLMELLEHISARLSRLP